MMLIRPVNKADTESLMKLSQGAGVGVTTLPSNEEILEKKIENSLLAFASISPDYEERSYLFVLEDTTNQTVVGVCGIEAHVGLTDPWYNYRLSTLVHASRELHIYESIPTLFWSNDYTGYSEICSLFLDANYRKNKNGSFLSKSRFMFMAACPQYFHKKLIAEMRGVSDEKGISPFWESVGRRFFAMNFYEADYLCGIGNKAFIAELMPKYPIYANMLDEHARNVIGQVHQDTNPAYQMLYAEGFRFENYVDIFDAGPVIEAPLDNIRTIKESCKVSVIIAKTNETNTDLQQAMLYLISNEKYEEFRCLIAPLNNNICNEITVTVEMADKLGVCAGDDVRIAILSAGKV